ncbi:MAG: phospholipid scramblase 1 [Geoglossum umbratile]|nr:MAG: phospholipid scramblase 1 [Geoglossum umbratile]
MNRVLISYIIFDLLFLATGVLLLVATLTQDDDRNPPTRANVARKMLLSLCPLRGEPQSTSLDGVSQTAFSDPKTAAFVNGVFIIFAFMLSLPGLALPTSRMWLWMHGWLVAFCITFTLALGVDLWLQTLKMRSNLSTLWARQSPQIQGLLQETFNCCGYMDSSTPPFQPNSVCPNSLKAANMPGCVWDFSNYTNTYLGTIFTASFGIVALDVLLLLNVSMVLKQRREQKRYRHIDEKNGLGSI